MLPLVYLLPTDKICYPFSFVPTDTDVGLPSGTDLKINMDKKRTYIGMTTSGVLPVP